MAICDCCNIHQACGVASVPMAPISISYCIPCLKANNYPLWLLTANTAMLGGLNNANLEWFYMVQCSLLYQGVSFDQFNLDVQTLISQMEQEIHDNA